MCRSSWVSFYFYYLHYFWSFESHSGMSVTFYAILKTVCRSSCCGSAVTNLNSNHENVDSIRGLAQWVTDMGLPQTMV